jgi:hypothetical protein
VSPSYLQSEEVVRHLVLWLRLAVETLKLAAIAVIRTGLNFFSHARWRPKRIGCGAWSRP